MEKFYINANDLLCDSFRLAHQVYSSGFRPDYIVGIWRGGAPIGIAVQEYYEFKQCPTDHIAVRTSAYAGIDNIKNEIKVHGLHYLTENANAEDSILIVDDVFDSGRSVQALLSRIQELMRKNTPSDIRIATPWYKPANNKTQIVPDYFVHQSNQWLVFPHELEGLSEEEIKQGKPELAGIMDLLSAS